MDRAGDQTEKSAKVIEDLVGKMKAMLKEVISESKMGVALHAAGISQMDIKFALRWKSDTFYTYLRNLPCQAARTHAAVVHFNPNVFTLVPTASAA
jgi:hypothetical protein